MPPQARHHPRRRHALRLLVALVAVAAVTAVTACSGDDGSGGDGSRGAAVPADATATEILDLAGTVLAGAKGLTFVIEREGGQAFIDESRLLAFVSADGRFQAPRSADAILTVEVNGLRTEVGAVAIDGSVWITNPISGAWEPAPANLSFDPAALFSPDEGLPSVMRSGVSDPVEIDRTNTERHVRATVDAAHIGIITSGLIDTGTEVDFFIDAASAELRRAKFVVPVDGTDTEWTISLDGYGSEFDIVSPNGD